MSWTHFFHASFVKRFFLIILCFFLLPPVVHSAFIYLHITVLGSYHEHFSQTSVQQPDGWMDEDNNGDYNAQLTTNGLGSAKLTKVDANNYGQAVSAYMTMDLDTFDTLTVVVTEVDTNTDYKVSLLLQSPSPLIDLSTPLTGAGIHTYDIKAITSWSGVQTFAIVLTVESTSNGVGTQFDEIKITDSSTPPAYIEHFEEAAGQPSGWWDETNDSNNNAEINGNGLDSAHVGEIGTEGWGKVLSDTLTIDLDTYGYLSAIVTDVDSGSAYKITVKLNGNDTLHELYSGTDTGKFYFDIKAVTGWSGSQSFSIVLVAESGSDNIGARFDEIKIDRIAF